MSRAGFQAYAAYCLAINPQSRPIDGWRQLPEQFREAWTHAAYAVEGPDDDRDENQGDSSTVTFEVVDDDEVSERVVNLPDTEHPIGILGGNRRGFCFTANGARTAAALLTKGVDPCPASSLN